ncbi:hypothetical protein [Brevibacillus sp. SYSU BS000544]|uniref:hypothetical protein n=1 Tax=Brevibacillus sp. SYSU BS000544 TaxID=3416443 RepID=UPI003CE59380
MFEASSVLSFGPFHITISVASLVLGVILALGWISYEGKKYSIPWVKSFIDTISQAFLVGILVYKFWPLMEDPLLFLKEPVRLLFTSGGVYAIEVAVLISSLWFLMNGVRGKWLGWIAAGWMLFGNIIVELLLAVLVKSYGEPAWIEVIVYLCLVGILINEGRLILSKAHERVGMILVGVSSVTLLKYSLISMPADPFILGRSLLEMLSLVILIIGMLILLTPARYVTHRIDDSAGV